MKTETDLLNLITLEVSLNEGKAMEYAFDNDTKYKKLKMSEVIEGEEDTILFDLRYKTPEQLQQVYWTIINAGRIKTDPK